MVWWAGFHLNPHKCQIRIQTTNPNPELLEDIGRFDLATGEKTIFVQKMRVCQNRVTPRMVAFLLVSRNLFGAQTHAPVPVLGNIFASQEASGFGVLRVREFSATFAKSLLTPRPLKGAGKQAKPPVRGGPLQDALPCDCV